MSTLEAGLGRHYGRLLLACITLEICSLLQLKYNAPYSLKVVQPLTALLVGVSVLTDLLFALLPIPLLWRVQMNTRTKAVVIAILSLGVL